MNSLYGLISFRKDNLVHVEMLDVELIVLVQLHSFVRMFEDRFSRQVNEQVQLRLEHVVLNMKQLYYEESGEFVKLQEVMNV